MRYPTGPSYISVPALPRKIYQGEVPVELNTPKPLNAAMVPITTREPGTTQSEQTNTSSTEGVISLNCAVVRLNKTVPPVNVVVLKDTAPVAVSAAPDMSPPVIEVVPDIAGAITDTPKVATPLAAIVDLLTVPLTAPK